LVVFQKINALCFVVELNPFTPEVGPSTSKCHFHEPATPQLSTMTLKKRSIFRGIANLSRSEATPRKKKLMEIIEKKEDHVRKLKKKCKDHAHSIKALSNLADSNVVTSLFKDMPSSTVLSDTQKGGGGLWMKKLWPWLYISAVQSATIY
jgi:hypothetical protein